MSNRKLVFYGAGERAALIFRRTKAVFAPREVVAFVDSDVNKQGHTYWGLPVMSWMDACRQFGDVDVYVSANERVAPEIIGFLLENDVAPERIVNYEPVEKRLGCAWAETYLGLQPEGGAIVMQCCARNEIDEVLSRTPYMNNTPVFDIGLLNRFIDLKYGIANDLKKRNVHKNCDGCAYIKETYYYQSRKIRQLAVTAAGACNFKCIYCSNKHFELYRHRVFSDSHNAISKVINTGLVDKDVFMALSSGEFSISNDGNRLAELISRYQSSLFTNAFKWSEAAAQALESGNSYLYVSVDAGTRDTFKKIKGVDAFGQVCANLKEYASKGTVVLKYILCEGLNENDADLEGFFKLADEVASLVVLSRDYYQKGSLSNETLLQCAKFILHFRETSKMGSLVGFDARWNERARLNEALNP
jgi:pyruvate-formate lyase-activating enzyme